MRQNDNGGAAAEGRGAPVVVPLDTAFTSGRITPQADNAG